VNLGAGFDTHPYRLPALSNLPVWEVDQCVNIEAKAKRRQAFRRRDTSKQATMSCRQDRPHTGSGHARRTKLPQTKTPTANPAADPAIGHSTLFPKSRFELPYILWTRESCAHRGAGDLRRARNSVRERHEKCMGSSGRTATNMTSD
jgi:hypothetical protein